MRRERGIKRNNENWKEKHTGKIFTHRHRNFLKHLFQKVMIVGRVQYDAGNPGIIYDYSGVYYPQGLIDPQKNLLFQHTDILEAVSLS